MAETTEVEYHSLTSSFNRSPMRLNSSITSPKSVARVVRKYQIHTKTYSPKWELDPNYRGWVQRSQRGDGFFYCLACSKDYTCGKSELDKHASSKKHCINLKSMIASASQMEAAQLVKTDVGESVESMFLDEMNSSSTSFVTDEDSSHREEETFGKYIVSELKRIKKKKTYELVKWEILQALQKAILEEVETES